MKTLYVLIASLALGYSVRSQGTFVYDQQSADESTGGGGTVPIQSNQPIGQSFTPTFNSIGFIRLFIGVPAGSTFSVNLLTNSITGPVLGVSDGMVFSSSFSGFTNFFFSTPVSLTPGSTYFFQPVISAPGGGGVIVAYNGYNYAGGNAYEQGVALPSIDLWFREGVVPEPSSLTLMATSVGILALTRRLKRRRSNEDTSV